MSVADTIESLTIAEQHGFELGLIIEGFADPYSILAAAAMRTHSIKLGTGVATTFTRTPTLTAINAATVDSISKGRFVLGIGAGHRENHILRDDVEVARPLPFANALTRMRESIEVIRLVLSQSAIGQPTRYEGSIFKVDGFRMRFKPFRPSIPIYVGALAEKTLAMAGALANGVMPNLIPIESVPAMIRIVRQGAEAAGRDPDEVDIGGFIPTCVSSDGSAARRAMRHHVSSYVVRLEFYRRHFERLGEGAAARQIVKLAASGDPASAADCVTDQMLDSTTIAGAATHCKQQLERFRLAGIALPILFPIHPDFQSLDPAEGVGDGVRSAIQELGPTPVANVSSNDELKSYGRPVGGGWVGGVGRGAAAGAKPGGAVACVDR